MNLSALKHLSLVRKTLSKSLYTKLKIIHLSVYGKEVDSKVERNLNVYAAFLFIQGIKDFSEVNIPSNQDQFQEHVDQLMGFIFHESENLSYGSKSKIARPLLLTMAEFAKLNNINFTLQSTGYKRSNDYTQKCLESYQLMPVLQKKLVYLQGWELMSHERKSYFCNLDFLYVRYGQGVTAKIHDAIRRFGLTQKSATLDTIISLILGVIETVALLDDKRTVESFEVLLSEQHVQSTFLKVYQLQLSRALVEQADLKSFHRRYCRAVNLYTTVFINTKIYPAPLMAFIIPVYKTPINPPSFSTGGDPSELEELRWFADIPLQIRDDEAIAIIESRINRDMSFFKAVLINYFNYLIERQTRNKAFIKLGQVKALTGNVGGSNSLEVGMSHLDNTIATFYHYGINGYTGASFIEFLGYRGKCAELQKELNLPTSTTLFALTALLVYEHPQITPAWLHKLKLFNENGKLTGYLQVNNQYILTSEKSRRGRALAQQDVILNEFSIKIVEFIIEHTELARQHLKAQGNSDWQYLLLTCSILKALRPSLSSTLYKPRKVLNILLKDTDYLPVGHGLSAKDVNTIANIATHRSIRRHRGLQIYLETRSQSAVSDALGHKKTDPLLLESYLPTPLMNFFTERVIRQFQSAIILKSMEGSCHLLDAINMTYEEIEEFLENHGLEGIPDFNSELLDSAASKIEKSLFDNIVFTVSVPLIQLLISIKTIIDTDYGESEFAGLVKHWYQSATYLLQRFEMGDFEDNEDIENMYLEAKKKPLNHNIIKGVLLSC
ncbi:MULTISPECIES: hypothetical protein [Vibrio]|uniref:hypothetical protein n=1 Tax=Vibrio TaxID=662 RepID=UPI0006A5DC89|nr:MULTISPECIES: hypothetical protein [Vibrio]KOE82138.1 hypothetical protein ACS86_10115 [Vibrio alginolyticus]MCS0365214.1 hypothetical protein [Vibrio diabolicus]MDE1329696.1 hypothetical protein [Vibrio aestuarianus]